MATPTRNLECPDEYDDPPDRQTSDFFGWVRASLYTWMQALTHLRPKKYSILEPILVAPQFKRFLPTI